MYKSVNCLDKQSGFSIEPAAQYCSVACERVSHMPDNTESMYREGGGGGGGGDWVFLIN